MPTCNKCSVDKDASAFYRSARRASGVTPDCKGCRNDHIALRQKTDPAFRAGRRAAKVKAQYHLTQDQVDAMLAAQGGVCAICGTDQPGGRGDWHIDHDHSCCPGKKSCGKCVRGLLCAHCNVGIGMLRESPELLQRATDYLSTKKAA